MAEHQLPKLDMGVRFPSLAWNSKQIMKNSNKRIRILSGITFVAFIFLAGCVSAPVTTLPKPPKNMPGIYHKTERGQTLWRISKLYNIDLDELTSVNHISDATRIETGQLIFIPHRTKPQAADIKYTDDDFIWPLKGKVITPFASSFRNMVNKGVNIAPYSSSDIVASRNGKVVFYSGSFPGFGKTIIIDHGDGFSTVYSGSSEILVTIGQAVTKGTPIAKINLAGRRINNYLHFEIRKSGIAKNPYYYLP